MDSFAAVEQVLGPQVTPTQYLALRDDEVQCLAADNSTLANLIEAERQVEWSAGLGHLHARCQVAAIRSELLSLRAASERNRAAAAALELFYRLAEAEYGRDALQRSLQEAQAVLENVELIRAKGLPVDADEHALRRQVMELLDQRTELHLSIDQLNGQLQLLLGLDPGVSAPIWPIADLRVDVEPIDMEATVARGLAGRWDLAIIRLLEETLDEDMLPTVRRALQEQAAALGAQVEAPGALLRHLVRHLHGAMETEMELQTRWSQLERLLGDRERSAAEQIRMAVRTVETRLRQAALANESLESHRQRLDELQQLHAVDRATVFDISAAQLEAIRAENELVRQVIAWRIAEVQLRESMGLLALECGYDHPALFRGAGRDGHYRDGHYHDCRRRCEGGGSAGISTSPTLR